MERQTQAYGHFCILARTLERVGDRWTLLVVRDLAHGPRRFTDLMELLGGITPKTLTQRLRDLEADGIAAADRVPGRREVWYRLTPAGEDLLPVLDQLRLWGLKHAARPPKPGEPVHPEHLLTALKVKLDAAGATGPPARLLVRVAGTDSYTLSYDGLAWTLTRGETDDPDVTITATRDGLARFLTTQPAARSLDQPDLTVAGTRQAIRAFLKTIAVFPFGPDAAVPAGRQPVGSR